MKQIRTRFAPSPTGYIHIGNIRAALFPWLFARQNGGKFILRIEDTDQARLVEGATDLIYDSLKWLGLNWDEGPDISGDYGPYVQTERRETYLKWAQKLIDKGLAYADPYTESEVEEFRKSATANKKAFLYRDYRPSSLDSKPLIWDGSKPLRFKVPEIKRYSWHDPVMGDLSAGPEALDDFILIKSDGLPTYNFAHIVDDAEMQITHIMRGLEYIPSIPKYLSLYEALEIEPPVLVCMPHIMAPEGNKKLGKRDGAKSLVEYRKEGYLPETMINFLASLGWNDGTEQEIFSIEELIEKFSLNRIQKSGAKFDAQHLLWMNGQWIRKLSVDDLYARTAGFWPDSAEQASESEKKKILALVQDRLKTLADIPVMTSYFFGEPTPDKSMITENNQLGKLPPEQIKSLLESSKSALATSDFAPESLQNTLNALLETTGQKPAVLFSLIRIAISWAPFSPSLNDTLAALGRDKTINRLQIAINLI